MNNGWKITAIVFIILFLAETLFLITILSIGYHSLNKENSCNNICVSYDSDSFLYDDITGWCSCTKDGEEVYQERLL